uniref:Uncharacterized protein n=1 Tax=Trypanosoma congolense (strain IL3000) TaxID=1068625 RepID=F9W5P8_TRYCI|nr:hypothetical protein, unlikely [Trypanosoma congolense IL3000]
MVGLVCKSTGGGSTCPAPGERGEPPALLGTLFDEGQPLGVILECSAEPGPDATTFGARIVSQNNGSSYLGMGSVQTSSAPASGGVRSASSGSCCGGGSDSAECGGPTTRVYVSAAAPSEVVCTGTTTPNAAPCGGIFGEFEWAKTVWHE